MVTRKTDPPRTLEEANRMAALLWPGREAPLPAWLDYHQQRADLFSSVAESDPGHRHEAQHLAGVEREEAVRVTALLAAEQVSAQFGNVRGRRTA